MYKSAAMHISTSPVPRSRGVLCGCTNPASILAHSHVGTMPERECIRCRSIFDAQHARRVRDQWARRAQLTCLTAIAAWYHPFCDAPALAHVVDFWAKYLSDYAAHGKAATVRQSTHL